MGFEPTVSSVTGRYIKPLCYTAVMLRGSLDALPDRVLQTLTAGLTPQVDREGFEPSHVSVSERWLNRLPTGQW